MGSYAKSLVSSIPQKSLGNSDNEFAEYVLRQVKNSPANRRIKYMATLKSGTKIMKTLLPDKSMMYFGEIENTYDIDKGANKNAPNATFHEFGPRERLESSSFALDSFQRHMNKYNRFDSSSSGSSSDSDSDHDRKKLTTKPLLFLNEQNGNTSSVCASCAAQGFGVCLCPKDSSRKASTQTNDNSNSFGNFTIDGVDYGTEYTDSNLYDSVKNKYARNKEYSKNGDTFDRNLNLNEFLGCDLSFFDDKPNKSFRSNSKQDKSLYANKSGVFQGTSKHGIRGIKASEYAHRVQSLFLKRFCNDELLYYGYTLSKRIQYLSARASQKKLIKNLEKLLQACRSTRLNLKAIATWEINQPKNIKNGCVTDYLFVINMSIVMFNTNYSKYCIDKFCVNPLCRAFRRVLNIVLNEGLRQSILTREEKSRVRRRLVNRYVDLDERILVVRELVSLLMLGERSRYRDLAKYAITRIGLEWEGPNEESPGFRENGFDSGTNMTGDTSGECNLDPKKVYEKAIQTLNDEYISSILNTRALNFDFARETEVGLLDLWNETVEKETGIELQKGYNMTSKTSSDNGESWNQTESSKGNIGNSGFNLDKQKATKNHLLSLPMILHLLVFGDEMKLEKILRSNKPIPMDVSSVEEMALQIVMSLGLTWELSEQPIKDYRLLCVSMLIELGSVLNKLVVFHDIRSGPRKSLDDVELQAINDELFSGNLDWFITLENLINYEYRKNQSVIAQLLVYLMITSKKLLGQRSEDFDPEVYLTCLIELLTEYRKRRPDYDYTVVWPEYSYNANCVKHIDTDKKSDFNTAVGRIKNDRIPEHLVIPMINYRKHIEKINQKQGYGGIERGDEEYESGSKSLYDGSYGYEKKGGNVVHFGKPVEGTSTSFNMRELGMKSINGEIGTKGWERNGKKDQIKKMEKIIIKSGTPLDMAKREAVGADFDRLYSWINKNFTVENKIRGMLNLQHLARDMYNINLGITGTTLNKGIPKLTARKQSYQTQFGYKNSNNININNSKSLRGDPGIITASMNGYANNKTVGRKSLDESVSREKGKIKEREKGALVPATDPVRYKELSHHIEETRPKKVYYSGTIEEKSAKSKEKEESSQFTKKQSFRDKGLNQTEPKGLELPEASISVAGVNTKKAFETRIGSELGQGSGSGSGSSIGMHHLGSPQNISKLVDNSASADEKWIETSRAKTSRASGTSYTQSPKNLPVFGTTIR
ncbi:hypothetical protein BB560_000353 [Smittium megazygosporum]|uniref:Uncharacterized protein n=1 Tax=Smittium megazygosporum TaxID=133381 RepID=A0A2T9ZKS3_9FUNG|nr:hypothetical protein BB560_000353 [Smittium megazygosporum]